MKPHKIRSGCPQSNVPPVVFNSDFACSFFNQLDNCIHQGKRLLARASLPVFPIYHVSSLVFGLFSQIKDADEGQAKFVADNESMKLQSNYWHRFI